MFNFKVFVALAATLLLCACNKDSRNELLDVGGSPDPRLTIAQNSDAAELAFSNTQVWLSDSKTQLLVADGEDITTYDLDGKGVNLSLQNGQLQVEPATSVPAESSLILDAFPFDPLPTADYDYPILQLIGIVDMSINLTESYSLVTSKMHLRWYDNKLFVTEIELNNLCTYRGEFEVSSGNSQIQTEHGIFIFNQLNNTISIVSDLDIHAINLLKFDQPASQCFLQNPEFECNEIVCVVSPSHPEFWDCVSEGTDFCYELVGSCIAVSDDEPAFD